MFCLHHYQSSKVIIKEIQHHIIAKYEHRECNPRSYIIFSKAQPLIWIWIWGLRRQMLCTRGGSLITAGGIRSLAYSLPAPFDFGPFLEPRLIKFSLSENFKAIGINKVGVRPRGKDLACRVLNVKPERVSLSFFKAGQGPVRWRQDVLGKTVEKVLAMRDGFPYPKGSNYGRKPDA